MHFETREELIEMLESGSDAVYEPVPGGFVELKEQAVKLCEQHGIRIAVDAYGCTYAPDHLIR